MNSNTNSKEQQFLAKIAEKLGRPTPSSISNRTAGGPPDFWKNIIIEKEELLQQFKYNAKKLTMRIEMAKNNSEMPAKLGEWLKDLEAKTAICWDLPQLKDAITESCKAAGVELILWDNRADREEMIKKCAEADVGITWADYGVANTGSLALLSNPSQSRSVSLLPPVHIAILKAGDILPHMGDIFLKLNTAKLPSSLTFITGPSRTSDIEMDLTLGVHGPGKVFVLILEE